MCRILYILDYEGLLDVPSSAGTLVISYVGMHTEEIDIQPNVTVRLRSNAELLDEVMVVAYGTAKKSAFTGSATVVGSEDIEKIQTSNVANALKAHDEIGAPSRMNNGA